MSEIARAGKFWGRFSHLCRQFAAGSPWCDDFVRLYRGTVITVPYSAKNPPFPEKRGILNQNVRPYTQSGDRQIRTMPDHTSSARLTTSKISECLAPGTAELSRPSILYHARPHEFCSSFDKQNVGQFGSRHCRATDRAVSARLTARTTYQTRVCPRRLAVKNPPFPEKRGIFHTICSIPYAERKLATGRAVLLDFRQVKPNRHEFGSRHCRSIQALDSVPCPTTRVLLA